MSSISLDIPTLEITENDLTNLLKFIYMHKNLLKQYGALKIKLNNKYKLPLKRQTFPLLPETIQRLTKIHQNEPIYYSYLEENLKKEVSSPSSSPSIDDETSFWSNLSLCNNNLKQSSISILHNKSFFRAKSNRTYFNMRHIPKQSLLKLGGQNLTNQFNPYLIRSHGKNAVIPLNSNENHLCSLIYHHTGGPRYWYIIPFNERKNLENILLKENLSICFDHNHLLIDPSFFIKYNIRYHKIIQNSNEFVVLSEGILFQSLFQNEIWNESINFALPSWIEDGHAYYTCQCRNKNKNLSKKIDFTFFRHELIQRYIQKNFNENIQRQLRPSKDSNEENFVSTNLWINNESYLKKVNDISLVNMKPTVQLQQIQYKFDESAPELILFRTSNTPFDQYQQIHNENTDQNQSLQQNEISFLDMHDNNMPMDTTTESIIQEYLPELSNTVENQSYPTCISDFLSKNITSDTLINNELVSYEDLINITAFTPPASVLTYSQTDQSKNVLNDNHSQQSTNNSLIPNNNSTTDFYHKIHVKKQKIKKKLNGRKTLFISQLRRDVGINDLYHHFIGCIKVTLKQCQTTPHFQYAFVIHRTSRDAEYNLLQPIDRIRFGSTCRIEYAHERSRLRKRYQSYDEKKIFVSRIPENVSENDLQNLFANCQILQYCPARYAFNNSKRKNVKEPIKLLWGYAFLQCDNAQQAVNVIKYADQYKINDKSLYISFYHKKYL